MKLPRDISGYDLARHLSRLDYEITRQKDSHIRLTCPAMGTRPEHHVTIPNHDSLKIGTLASILDNIAIARGITRDALIELLFG